MRPRVHPIQTDQISFEFRIYSLSSIQNLLIKYQIIYDS